MDSESAKRTDIDHGLKIYLTALALAAVGWIGLGTFAEPSSAAAPSTREPGSVELLLFALAVVSGVRAHVAADESRAWRDTFGEPEVAAQVRFTRLRRLLLALGLVCLVVAVIMIVVGWIVGPSWTTTLARLYLGFLVAGVTSLVGARGVRRGWIEVASILEQPTPQDVHAALNLLAKQKEEIRKNETVLRAQRNAIRDIYKSIKEDEQRAASWIPSNLRWALVGFVLGIVGNWLTEPLFKILIAPLNA